MKKRKGQAFRKLKHSRVPQTQPNMDRQWSEFPKSQSYEEFRVLMRTRPGQVYNVLQ